MFRSTSSPTEGVFVFVVGDQVISGTGYTTHMSVNYPPPLRLQSFFEDEMIIRRSGPFTLEVGITANEFTVGDNQKVSRKLVKDCSIEELIFAISEKAKGKK